MLCNPAFAKPSFLSLLRKTVLLNTDSRPDSLIEVERHKATVFIFLSSECPISNSYMTQLGELAAEFAKNDIIFYGVISDPGVSSADAKKFADDYKFTSPILMDSKQVLASLLKAHITPEVFIISGRGKIEYQGRVDDRFVALGKGRVKARHKDLRNALANIAEGKKIKTPRTKVIGCWIPGIGK